MEHDAAFEQLTPDELRYEKQWPQKPGLSMEDVVRRLDKYGAKGKLRIPTKGRHNAQEWREAIVKTARIAQQYIVKEKVRRHQMPPPTAPDAPPGGPEQPPRPWGDRTQARPHPADAQADDRHSRHQVGVERAGILGGSRRRRKPPDDSHSNARMASLESASDTEMTGASPAIHRGDQHENLVDLTLTSDEGGSVAPSPHYRQGEDDFPDETDANNKYAISLGFRNQKAWNEAWAAQYGEANTEEMHRMIRSGAIDRSNKVDRGDDMMARTYGYKDYKDMFKSVPSFQPDMTGVQWNTHIAQMRKYFQREIEHKSPKSFLGGWTIAEAAKAMGASSHAQFVQHERANAMLQDWGKKHKALRKHWKDTSGTPDLNFVAKQFGFKDFSTMNQKFKATGKSPNVQLKKIFAQYRVKTDAPAKTPDERHLKADPRNWRKFGHPSQRGPSPEAVVDAPFALHRFGFHSANAVAQNRDDAKEQPPPYSSSDVAAIQGALDSSGQPTHHGRQPVVTPLRLSSVGSRRNPRRAAREQTLTYERSRTPTELMPLGDPRRQQKTPTKESIQKKIRAESVKVDRWDIQQLKQFMDENTITYNMQGSVDQLRQSAKAGIATMVRKAAGIPAAVRTFQQPGSMRTGHSPRMPARKRRRGSVDDPLARASRRNAPGRGAHKRSKSASRERANSASLSRRHGPISRHSRSRTPFSLDQEDEKMAVVNDPPTPGVGGTPERRRLLTRHLTSVVPYLAPPKVHRRAAPRTLFHPRLRYLKSVGVTAVAPPRNIVSPFRMNYKSRGGYGWTPTPRLSVNQIDAGRYLLRSRRGVTKGIRHQVMHLLNRVRGKIKVNGRLHSKRQAREVIIDLLAQNITVDVELSG